MNPVTLSLSDATGPAMGQNFLRGRFLFSKVLDARNDSLLLIRNEWISA